jgi:hypothetical protein
LINNDDDEINFGQIEGIFDSASEFRRLRASFRSRNNSLFEKGIVENATSNGFGSRESFKITDKAQKALFSEINIHSFDVKSKKDLILSSSLTRKELVFEPAENKKFGGS